ncbi:MAG TPA: YopJ family acetyltransferase [Herbaspirillum sp.]
MYPVLPSITPPPSPPLAAPLPRSSPRPTPAIAETAPPAPLEHTASGANPATQFNAWRLIAQPRPRPQHANAKTSADPGSKPKLATAAYRLKKHASLMEEAVSRNIRGNWPIFDGDVQNLPAFIAYINQERPGLNLRYADSSAALLDALEQAPERSHLRFILQDKLARARSFDCPVYLYAEFSKSQDRKVSGWMLVQAASGPSGASSPTVARLLLDAAARRRLAGMRLMPVDTYNQANKFDTVMFAAHAAWTAHDNASAFEALHERARTDAGPIGDFGKAEGGGGSGSDNAAAGRKQAIFCRSYYEYRQTASGERMKDADTDYMSIFHFRRQLLAGAAEMQQQSGQAAGTVNRTMPSSPMRRSSAPANQS